MSVPSSLPPSQPDESVHAFLLARVDAILADWQARHLRAPSDGGFVEQACGLRDVVAGVVGVAAVDPRSRTAQGRFRTLALAAAGHGAQRRAQGQPLDVMAYEYSVLFEAISAALSSLPTEVRDEATVADRIQHAFRVTVSAAFIGYELGGDATQRTALEAALEQCCVPP